MDYILNTYVFRYMPFDLPDEWRSSITSHSLDLVRFMDWLCKAQDPRKLFDGHTSFFVAELVFLFLFSLTFIHAYRHGGRYIYTWLAVSILAINVETLSVWLPDVNNSWHAQGLLTFFGMRVPLSCLLGVNHMYYAAYVFVQRMHLPWWAEGPAMGTAVVMLRIPYSLCGAKLLWWTLHDTDPNIVDRAYNVPWSSCLFHAALACSFVWSLNVARKALLSELYDWKKFCREFLCALIAGTTAFWLAVLQLALFYHPLHDWYKISGGAITLAFIALCAIVVYAADRRNANPASRAGNPYWFDELSLALCVYFLFYAMLVCVADPKNTVSVGLHQPIGPCNENEPVYTPIGGVLKRSKFLCLRRHEGKYFDFHCIPGGKPPPHAPDEPLEWYAACGTPFENRAEYIFIIWACCLLFSALFYQAAAKSGRTPKIYRVIYRRVESPPKPPELTPLKQQPPSESETNTDAEEEEEDEAEDGSRSRSQSSGTRSRSSSRRSSTSLGRRATRSSTGKKEK